MTRVNARSDVENVLFNVKGRAVIHRLRASVVEAVARTIWLQ